MSNKMPPLPPLPAYTAPEIGMYANHQMREYARAYGLLCIEEAARVCDLKAEQMYEEGEGPTGYISFVIECADAIRAIAKGGL